MMESPHRVSASPYARRLAQTRSIQLGLLTGSGPAGRIVAADVRAFTPVSDAVPQGPVASRTEVRPPGSSTQPASVRSAFSTTISPGALNALIADAQTAGFPLDLEDIALRATSHAMTIAGLSGARAIAFESGGRQVIVDADLRLSVGHHRKSRLAALNGTSEDAVGKPILSLQVVGATRVTALLLSLPPSQAMRLRLSKGTGADSFSALLCTDSDAIPDDVAVVFLSAFAEALEQPLALLS
jgi:hypothetical protein